MPVTQIHCSEAIEEIQYVDKVVFKLLYVMLGLYLYTYIYIYTQCSKRDGVEGVSKQYGGNVFTVGRRTRRFSLIF